MRTFEEQQAFCAASEAAPDDQAREGLLQGASILSYNLSADLADCWPGDTLERTRAHFEAGRQRYQKACDRFKAQLDDEKSRDDAQFGLDQLAAVRTRYLE